MPRRKQAKEQRKNAGRAGRDLAGALFVNSAPQTLSFPETAANFRLSLVDFQRRVEARKRNNDVQMTR